jgi:hypothetical protein
MSDTLPPAMINRIHSVISRSLKQAVREQILQNNPAEYTVRPPIKSKEVTILSPEEINRYLDIAKNTRQRKNYFSPHRTMIRGSSSLWKMAGRLILATLTAGIPQY